MYNKPETDPTFPTASLLGIERAGRVRPVEQPGLPQPGLVRLGSLALLVGRAGEGLVEDHLDLGGRVEAEPLGAPEAVQAVSAGGGAVAVVWGWASGGGEGSCQLSGWGVAEAGKSGPGLTSVEDVED